MIHHIKHIPLIGDVRACSNPGGESSTDLNKINCPLCLNVIGRESARIQRMKSRRSVTINP